MTLTPTSRRALRARAHHLQPVVMIGEAGLTPDVLREVRVALRAHELIKIRVLGDDRLARDRLLEEVCAQTGAERVQSIGKMLVIYRERPPEEQPAAPKARPRRKPPRRTKRSYQR